MAKKYLRIPEANGMNTGMWRLTISFKGSAYKQERNLPQFFYQHVKFKVFKINYVSYFCQED